MILGQTQKFASPEEVLTHISEAPWSNYTKADYTLEQWHAACVIHIHDGAPTSKSECKLPVKTPDGALNRNGVHAAAAALAGARGGLKGVSDDQKKSATTALKRYYSQLDEDPPDSLSQSVDLVHYGIKGMRWGVRKQDDSSDYHTARINEETKRDLAPKLTAVPETTAKAAPDISTGRVTRVETVGKSSAKNDDHHGLTPGQKKAL